AEDGIRDFHVTGVQTCALPISEAAPAETAPVPAARTPAAQTPAPCPPSATKTKSTTSATTPARPRRTEAEAVPTAPLLPARAKLIPASGRTRAGRTRRTATGAVPAARLLSDTMRPASARVAALSIVFRLLPQRPVAEIPLQRRHGRLQRLAFRHRFVAHDSAVPQRQQPVRPRGHAGVVGDDDD